VEEAVAVAGGGVEEGAVAIAGGGAKEEAVTRRGRWCGVGGISGR
jgi:hypothetical protein